MQIEITIKADTENNEDRELIKDLVNLIKEAKKR